MTTKHHTHHFPLMPLVALAVLGGWLLVVLAVTR